MTSASICEADRGAIPTAGVGAGHLAGSGPLGDRYRLEELVGQGGMGRVYRATDELLGRTVAVKVFPAAATDHADRARRDSETRLLASLSHPSLVTLYDADTLPDGSGYLVMEYVDGGTLGDRIARGPMAPQHVAHVAADLGEALHVVHAAGVIHRDIKPPNVLLRSAHARPFQATLADFGIAYLTDAARMTTPGMAVGTAAYFSPEQARGAQPSPASDIYAFGLVLIEALTGRRAFPQTTPIEAAIARLHTAPVVPAGFGYGWRSLLTAMTAADPEARPTALEVAERARVLTSSEPVAVALAQPAATEAVVLPELHVTAPHATAVVAVEEPTRLVPIERPALRTRDRRRRRARRGVATRLAATGAGVVALALGAWGVTAAAAPTESLTRHLETGVRAEQTADTTDTVEPVAVQDAPVQDAPVQEAPVQEAPVQTVEVQTVQAAQDKSAAPQGAAPKNGPDGSEGRGDAASNGPGPGVKTHGNGNGNGRSGVGTPGEGHGRG
jgi:tRNA A-37 threonylcarbamoyl transferase component Bud32